MDIPTGSQIWEAGMMKARSLMPSLAYSLGYLKMPWLLISTFPQRTWGWTVRSKTRGPCSDHSSVPAFQYCPTGSLAFVLSCAQQSPHTFPFPRKAAIRELQRRDFFSQTSANCLSLFFLYFVRLSDLFLIGIQILFLCVCLKGIVPQCMTSCCSPEEQPC